MTAELKPCPFCGTRLDGDGYYTHPKNGCFFNGWEFDMLDQQIAAWNRRTALPVQAPIPTLPTVPSWEAYPPRQQQSRSLPVQAGEGEASSKPVAWAVTAQLGGIHKLAITKESAERKRDRWLVEWPDNKCRVRPLVFGDEVAGGQGGEDGLIPCAYRVGPAGLGAVKIEEVAQIEGPALWAVRKKPGNCLNKAGEWEYEPMPSSRDDEFLARCRFATVEEARATLAKANDGEDSNG